MKYSLAAVAVALGTIASVALCEPKPSKVPSAWELEIQLEQPQAIQVQLPGDKSPRTFWYVRYTVTNHTDQEQLFVPEFVLYTDTGQTLNAWSGVSPLVYNKIKELYNDPLLKDQSGMTGKLLRGEDNAKRGVAIFQSFDPKAGIVDLFVGGLSGETQTMDLPTPITVTEDKDGQKVEVQKTQVVLSKTLYVKYQFPNSPNQVTARDRMAEVEKNWVMR